MSPPETGGVRFRDVSRSFRILHERNATLKEAILRRRRTHATELWALRNVDLDIEPGESVGIIGQNGSGKSTCLKLIAGILRPQSGTVETSGKVASMLELGAGFHPDFTGRENVYLNASIYGMSEREVDDRLDEIVDFAELADFIEMPVKTYSSGMSMRLAFAVASHVNPDILLLDEVLAVGDEAFQRKCLGRIFDYLHGGGTLVFVSHDPQTVERVCRRAVLLDGGAIVEDGTPADVLATYHRLLADGPSSGRTVRQAGEATPTEPSTDDPRIWGSREVVITEVRLLGANGEANTFVSGEPFAVEIDLEAARPIETPTLGIMISTADDVVCFGTNTALDALHVREITGTTTVRFAVDSLALLEGRFMLTVAVHSHDERTVYHWLDRWVSFTVFQRTSGVGIVDLTGAWSITDSAVGPPGRAVQQAQ